MQEKLINQLDGLITSFKSDNEILHDLMVFRVREILLVATIYDAFILEQEGQLTEQIFGEYYKLNLSTAPRITSVNNADTALDKIQRYPFDMVIIMIRIGTSSPFELSKKIKAMYPELPVLLLLNDNSDLPQLHRHESELRYFDNYFIWNGDSKIFVAMIKYIEDKRNVDQDTVLGLVRVILLVEDSVRYYSRYLPTLYTEIMKQVQQLIKEEKLDEMKKILRMRARPKVLMARNYEEAVHLIKKYRDYLLCLISDIKFPKNGELDEQAGLELVRFAKETSGDLPALIQSFNTEYREEALRLRSFFIDKNSDSLAKDLTHFIRTHLGFGDFVFRDENGNEIDRVSSMSEFTDVVQNIPENSLVYHAERNHFSAWLMARGEIRAAKHIQPMQVVDFGTPEQLRQFIINMLKTIEFQKLTGKVIPISFEAPEHSSIILQAANGSLGGKGRGIAFMNTLIANSELDQTFPEVRIQIPYTVIIGTDEFDTFMERHNFYRFVDADTPYLEIQRYFLEADLSAALKSKLIRLVRNKKGPLAVRSSGIFEDSLTQHFSGIYTTFLIPNNHVDEMQRYIQLQAAVKLIYASIFSPEARSYFEAIHYKIEEEKMAVVLQEVAGTFHGDRFYPHMSGVAQSYNYYPVSYMKPEDGITSMAVGLGVYVVGGEESYKFCPVYPKVDMLSLKEQFDHSQQEFYAIDLEHPSPDLTRGESAGLVKLPIEVAEKDGALTYSASVWDIANDRIQTGLNIKGPRIVNFPLLLRYPAIPLGDVLNTILELGERAIGTPVEIEFAITLHPTEKIKATFYLLQIKPMTADYEEYSINLSEYRQEDLFMVSSRALGNGQITHIRDIIYIDPLHFDRAEMRDMAREIENFNKKMVDHDTSYILMGPGRWGSSDPWLGIPIKWSQICNAQVIVETGLPDFHFDPSQGSHFFHNVMSMRVGYFTVPAQHSETSFIDWEWLRKQPIARKGNWVVHVQLKEELCIKMDGKKGIALILK